ncbi:MAG: primosomal protein N' [Spongiibacteraceae bacterium]
MPRYITAALPCPLRRSFDYLWPDSLPQPTPGSRVLLPFGPRRVVGVVTSSSEHSALDDSRLKSALQLLDATPSLSPDLLALGKWAAQYYHHPIGDCLQQMLPVALRKAKPPAEERVEYWQLSTEDLPAIAKRAHQQQALLATIKQAGLLSRSQIKDLGYSSSILSNLVKQGYLQAATPATASPTSTASAALELNSEQQQAVTAVTTTLGRFSRFLLHGVTGSGKTEVYLQAIEQCLARGEQALVLVPEIGLTPQTLGRFEARFPGRVQALHSGLSDLERLRSWQAVREQRCDILLGTRSAVLCEFNKLGLIVVDEEHDASYKQQDGWRYSARDIAVKRAADHQCPILLGSATPSLDSLLNIERQGYQLLPLTSRIGNTQAPSIQLLDIRQQRLQEGLSDDMLGAVKHCLDSGNQALIFLNRRGFSPVLQCHSCGWMAECPSCDARMTVHYGRRELRCHHCDNRSPLVDHCPQCQHHELVFQGPGTERLQLRLEQQFPDVEVIRIDRDTTSRKNSMLTLSNKIREGKPCILVGTQMLAKGHHFPSVSLVGIVDMDAGLFSSDFRAAERSGQLLIQVAGRAGRASQPGQVLLQTRCPDHPSLTLLRSGDYQRFATALLAERKALALPPLWHCAIVRADATDLASAEAFLRDIRAWLADNNEHWLTVGPLPAPMTRKAGRFRAALILQSPQRATLHQQLTIASDAGEKLAKRKGLRWSIDVDPIELF